MKSLLKYDNAIEDYVLWLSNNNYPVDTLFNTNDINICLGYILKYLSEVKNIYIIADSYNYTIFTTVEYTKLNGYIIDESNNLKEENEIGIMEIYKYAINITFEFLNVPF